LSADAWKRFSDEGFKHYEVTEPGFKYNMMDLQAALAIHQLNRIEGNLARRQEIWRRYDQAFADLPMVLPAQEEPLTRHARHLYTPLLDLQRLNGSRDEVQLALHRQRIGTGIHYRALHMHPYYRDTFNYRDNDYPNAKWISDRTLSLPLSPKLTDADVDDVILAFRNTVGHYTL
jgi:dTDP-4-amino-4,6-dideoxygalactose transaminase